MRHRNNVISIRASDVEYNVIKNLAGDAKETMTDYIIKCAMQKKINVIDVKPLITEVKRIGIFARCQCGTYKHICRASKNLQEVFLNGNRGCTEQ